ncbi:hypothetical protein L1987_08889 [Smallanthus sonchifolius]|uniref:Uncharacterized protein n=1 Tax=Smallanthus sonchifolius TaxID=185202 RepID=A0ACB9JLX3_9ASTR|nr:hypothetical protein L1987_08889 [Smallanthus sonchifolius]
MGARWGRREPIRVLFRNLNIDAFFFPSRSEHRCFFFLRDLNIVAFIYGGQCDGGRCGEEWSCDDGWLEREKDVIVGAVVVVWVQRGKGHGGSGHLMNVKGERDEV